MAGTVNQSGVIISSIASSHSSSSHDFSLSQPGSGHGPSPSRRPTPRASTAHFRSATTSPEDYFLPGVSPDTYTIYAIGGARIYHSTQLTGNSHHNTGPLGFSWGSSGGSSSKDKNSGGQWTFSHLKGTLVFGRDKQSMHLATMSQPILGTTAVGPTLPVTVGTPPPSISANTSQGDDPNSDWWFQLVDDATGKVVWKFKIPLSLGNGKFNYELDRPFFHVFRGSSRKYGFLFDDDKEAAAFSTEVISKITAARAATSKRPKNRSRSLSIRTTKKSKSKETSSPPSTGTRAAAGHPGVSISMISSPKPDSFRHVGHVGVNSTSGKLETSKDLDPSFREILSDLRLQSGTNVTESVVLDHLDFVQGFWKDIDVLQRNGSTSRPVVAN